MASSEHECSHRGEVAEFALGLLTGTDRADMLEHLETCGSCRAEVEGLAEVSDRLLLLTPPAEPPPGFESDVLAGMRPTRPPAARPAWRRAFVTLGSAAAAVAIALGVGWAFGSSSSQDQPFAMEAAMVTPAGRDVGSVRVQEGDPAWLLVSVPGWRHWDEQVGQALDYRVRVRLSEGASIEFDDVSLSEDGAWATTTQFDPSAVSEVSVIDATGRVWCTGHL